MNVWLMQIGEALPVGFNKGAQKMRTAVLGEKLVENGHQVTWWGSTFDHFQKTWLFKDETTLELSNGLKIIALKGIGYTNTVSLRRLIDHRIIAKKFKKLASSLKKPDIIITAMPAYDLAYEAVLYANSNNIPIIVDTRDQWPDIFANPFPRIFKKLIRLCLYTEFSMLEHLMENASGITSVSAGFLKWSLKYAKREQTWKDKVFYLGGSKVRSPGTLEFQKRLENNFTVTFIGTFTHYHDPLAIVEAAKRLKHITFVIAGGGEREESIRNASNGLPNLIMPGWLKQSQVSELLTYSNIGICPTSLDASLFPNKAFTYMSASLPVITAFTGDMKEFVEKHEIGFYYKYDDVDLLSEHISKLYEDSELYKKMSKKVEAVFDEFLDADTIYDNYVQYVEKMVTCYPYNSGE